MKTNSNPDPRMPGGRSSPGSGQMGSSRGTVSPAPPERLLNIWCVLDLLRDRWHWLIIGPAVGASLLFLQLIVDTFVSSAAINAGTSLVGQPPSGSAVIFIPVGSRVQIFPTVSPPPVP